MNRRCLWSSMLLLMMALPAIPWLSPEAPAVTIRVLGIRVDVDTRPDLDGLQYRMTAVRGFPTAVHTVVGAPGVTAVPQLDPNMRLRALLHGPAFDDEGLVLEALPNQPFEIAGLAVEGAYTLTDVRLEDGRGHRILSRDPTLGPVHIKVIDQLLVTQVSSRPLTLEEIREQGIVIDEENFTAVNFSVGLTLGSKPVRINLPVAIPITSQAMASVEPPKLTGLPSVQRAFDNIDIPNFSLSGFRLYPPPDIEEREGIELPPINGVIVIPGNIGFLNQFFSVILQATNVAPEASGLVLRNAAAVIRLPEGKDHNADSGDDPLRVARVRDRGRQKRLPLSRREGDEETTDIAPQQTNQAEFLVEGRREGSHRVDFDISGELFVPSLGRTVAMTGVAAGVVQVRNPSFSIGLAHPKVVRDGEEYTVFATVTNTSTSPANLFQLGLNTRSLSGARPADDESGLRTLDTLAPGQAETFEFRLIAETTGEVTGTVFLADEGINGNFLLTTGVGDTGIPLSPDTLVLPESVDYLPKEPKLLFQAVRLLGQAYSVATAPGGTLPPEIPRVRKSFVFDRAVKLAQAGLHQRFGDSDAAAVGEVLMDILTPTANRGHPSRADQDRIAFDTLRRAADAGHDLSDALGGVLARTLGDGDVAALQLSLAERYASSRAQMSFALEIETQPEPDPDRELKLETGGDDGHEPQSTATTGSSTTESLAPAPVSDVSAQSADDAPMAEPQAPAAPLPGPKQAATLELRLTDAQGRRLGRLEPGAVVRRELPFAARLPLLDADTNRGQWLLAPALIDAGYRLEFTLPPRTGARLSLILPGPDGMLRVLYPPLLPGVAVEGYLDWSPDGTDLDFHLVADDGGPSVLAPQSVTPVIDPPPRVLGVSQWAKGASPALTPSFADGDPLGRMIGVLFSEEVTRADALEQAAYQVPDNSIQGIALQPDQRLVFLLLDKPVGPFRQRLLTVGGIEDLAGKAMERAEVAISADPDRGHGAYFSGRVVSASGEPVPFASVKYIQPLSFPAVYGEGCMDDQDVADYVVTTYEADSEGRFAIDFVLQAEFPGACPSNPDQWLNRNNPRATQNFKLEAMDPDSGDLGRTSAGVHYDGQRMEFEVIIRGFGSLAGRLLAPSGDWVAGGEPGTSEALRVIARNVSTGDSSESWVDADGRWAFPRRYTDAGGRLHQAPKVAVGNIILHVVRPADGYSAVTTVNLPRAGAELQQDLMLLAPNQFAAVSGRVLEADGVTPAVNVPVQIAGRVLTGIDLYRRSYGRGVIGAAISDANGGFHFERVPTGDIELRAVRQSTYEQSSARAYLAAGETSKLSLVFPGSGGSVRGLVRDAMGRPVAGAKVAGGPTLTKADEQGEFEIKGLPLGSFTLFAQGADSPALGKQHIDSLRAGEVQDVVITLEPVGSMVGKVYAADGLTPVSGQRVQLWLEPDAGVLVEDFTRSDGSFRFDNYPVGDYSVRAVRRDRGDGGMTYASIRFAGDVQDVDIRFRGLGELRGRVIQSNGTPVISDIIVQHKQWRIYSEEDDARKKLIMEFVRSVQSQSDEKTAKQIEKALKEAGLVNEVKTFFMLADELVSVRSDGLGSNGEVNGEFRVGRVPAGPFQVSAFGPFLTPAERSGQVPRTGDPAKRNIDIGDLLLEPATSSVNGTVYLPNGKTPVGAGVEVRLRSLDSSGSVMTARGVVKQPILPEIKARTDADGHFDFPLMLRGRFVLAVDTAVPDAEIRARDGKEIVTSRWQSKDGKPALNVRLYGSAGGAAPAGETLHTDVRLQGAAALRVRVVDAQGKPVPFARVSLTTAGTLDADYEKESFQRQRADKHGEISFLPVGEGRFSLRAGMVDSPARGRADGEVPKAPADGTVIERTVTLGAVTRADGSVVRAIHFGTVSGQVLKADGSPLKHPAQVTVRAQGVDLLTSTGAQGRYTVDDVPGGRFSVAAFEPYTARRGEAGAAIEHDRQQVTVPITLTGLGTVTGSVLDHAGVRPIVGADVVLTPTGAFSGRIVTRSDQVGAYRLPGVPLGTYTVDAKDPESGLTGTLRGLLRKDGEIRSSNVRLAASGSIRGLLRGPAGEHPVANAQLVISGQGIQREVRSVADGGFDSGPWLLLGDYRVTARSAEGDDGVQTVAELERDGQSLQLDLRLAGIGRVRGQVLDSSGEEPEAKARVILTSHSPFSKGPVTRFSDDQGWFTFDRVPAGRFELGVRSTLREPELGARASGEVAGQGALVEFRDTSQGDQLAATAALRLQPAGSISGRVLLADGNSAAAGTVVALRGRRVRLGQECDDQGRFRFDALPLGDYRVSLRDTDSNGVAFRDGRLDSNGQQVVFDPVVLDDKPPQVVTLTPADGSVGADPGAPIVVRFSEAIDPASVNRDTLRVSVAGRPVAGRYTLSPDADEVSFQPDRPLPDLQHVELVVAGQEWDLDGRLRGQGIVDAAGRGLEEDRVLRFTTRDATAPQLLKTSPVEGADDVPVKTVIRLEFSEAVDRDAIQSATLYRNGKPVQGALNQAPILGGRVLVFAPRRPLKPNGDYRFVLEGPIRDASGNAMPQQTLGLGFTTLDTRAPKVLAVTVAGDDEAVAGKTLMVRVDLDESDDVAHVELDRNGQWLASRQRAPFEYPVYLDPALGTQLELGAVAVDRQGNRSRRVVKRLTVRNNRPPTVTIVSPTDGEISVGQTLLVRIAANDDIGLRRLALTVDEGRTAGLARTLDDPLDSEESIPLTLPEGHPVGGEVMLQAIAEDRLGSLARSPVVKLTVVDRYPPQITLHGVADRQLLEPGTTLDITLVARDAGGVARISLAADGQAVLNQVLEVDPPQLLKEQRFQIQVPADADPTAGIRLTARAVDREGNGGVTLYELGIHDRIPPKVLLKVNHDRTKAEPGHQLDVVVDGEDELGVSRIELLLNGKSQAIQEYRKPVTKERKWFRLQVPADIPLGESFELVALGEDAAGNQGRSVVRLGARDLSRPEAQVLEPKADSEFKQGAVVPIKVHAKDRYGVARLRISVSGAFDASQEQVFETPLPEVEQAFEVQIPVDAPIGREFRIKLEAFDPSGNVREHWSGRLRVEDRVAPTIVSVQPEAGDQAVAEDADIQLQFDEPLDFKTVKPETVQLLGPDGKPVPGGLHGNWDNDRVTFHPDQPLAMSTDYRLRVDGVTDRFGNVLEQAYELQFRIRDPDRRGPRLLNSQPSAGAEGVSLRPTIKLEFDESLVQKAFYKEFAQLLDEQGEARKLSVYAREGRTRLRLNFEGRLLPGTRYQLVFAPMPTDEAGNPIADAQGTAFTDTVLSFTTGALSLARPSPGERVAARSPLLIGVRPSEGMEPALIRVVVNGQELAPAMPPDFTTHYLTPTLADYPVLAVSMAAMDADGRLISQGSAEIPLSPVLYAEPALLGMEPGDRAMVELRLAEPLTQDLAIELSVGHPELIGLETRQLRLPAGQDRVTVAVNAIASGATFMVAKSVAGTASLMISVADGEWNSRCPPVSAPVLTAVVEQPIVANRLAIRSRAPLALAVSPGPLVLQGATLASPGVVLAVSPGVTLSPLQLPRAGRYRLRVSVPVDIATDARGLSTAPAVVKLVGAPKPAIEGVFRDLEVEAMEAGSALIRLREAGGAGRTVMDVPVKVGSVRFSPGALSSPPVQVAVVPLPAIAPLWMPHPGALDMQLGLLSEAAATDLPLEVVSSDPATVSVQAPSKLGKGSTMVRVRLQAGRQGHAQLRFTLGDTVLGMRVSVGGESDIRAQAGRATAIAVQQRTPGAAVHGAVVSIETDADGE